MPKCERCGTELTKRGQDKFCSRSCATLARMTPALLENLRQRAMGNKYALGKKQTPETVVNKRKANVIHDLLVAELANVLEKDGARILFSDSRYRMTKRPDLIFVQNGELRIWDVKTSEIGKKVWCEGQCVRFSQ